MWGYEWRPLGLGPAELVVRAMREGVVRLTDAEFEAGTRAPCLPGVEPHAHLMAVQAFTLIEARQAREDVKRLTAMLRAGRSRWTHGEPRPT